MKQRGVVCINCGNKCESSYRIYANGIIKLSHCEICGKPVDKYIEVEVSIILLDMLLLGKEALRHTIFNSDLQATWKLLLLIILSDGYRKWASSRPHLWDDNFEDQSYNSDLEWRFYTMCLQALIEYFTICALATLMLYTAALQKCPISYLIRGFIVSSFGKLFTLPVFLWKMNGTARDALLTCYIIICQVQACKVATGMSIASVGVIILLSWGITSLIFVDYLENFSIKIF